MSQRKRLRENQKEEFLLKMGEIDPNSFGVKKLQKCYKSQGLEVYTLRSLESLLLLPTGKIYLSAAGFTRFKQGQDLCNEGWLLAFIGTLGYIYFIT